MAEVMTSFDIGVLLVSGGAAALSYLYALYLRRKLRQERGDEHGAAEGRH